jgi:hypothetical protein
LCSAIEVSFLNEPFPKVLTALKEPQHCFRAQPKEYRQLDVSAKDMSLR